MMRPNRVPTSSHCAVSSLRLKDISQSLYDKTEQMDTISIFNVLPKKL